MQAGQGLQIFKVTTRKQKEIKMDKKRNKNQEE